MIIISASSFDASEVETLQIAAVTNGTLVELATPLQYSHQGEILQFPGAYSVKACRPSFEPHCQLTADIMSSCIGPGRKVMAPFSYRGQVMSTSTAHLW